jgi:hypothetical protein
MKIKISYGSCSISVLGTDITCPLCGTVVKSGQRHKCMKLPGKDAVQVAQEHVDTALEKIEAIAKRVSRPKARVKPR